MHPLAALVMMLAAGTPGGRCFVPSDQTAGWKRVVLPEEAPALAAPADVDWFRSGEPALLFEQDATAYTGADSERPGRMAYAFRVPRDGRRLELGFLGDLRGAKVDAVAYAGGRSFPLLDEKRLAGTQLALEWTMEGVEQVVVSVHHHLREKPVVRTWRVGRLLKPGEDPAMPESFRAPRSLYFLHPGGRRLELCDAPGRTPRLSRWPESTNASEVTLRRP
ncbi:hypothetical protein ATI61_103198 [Archangium gephyra]|uniref:Uncharacterized protein n=1 Tax=Archangium gephyra TaxID=48 RepID=A0AAC8Q5P1_9BACT|nr:hypothetical protein [Archangium gephyra]AKJ01490.1 Hypothetical protein AA314_03116 [Archangium gephyra]REG34305.1 hypothetical protein ATI61_103198 [Archangium gephyra]